MAEAHRRAHRQRGVQADLQVGHHRVPGHVRRYVRRSRAAQQLRLAQEAVAIEEGHRVAAVLQVDRAQWPPRRAGRRGAAVLVHEAHQRTILELRPPDRRAGIARAGGGRPLAGGERRAGPDRAIERILQQIEHLERALGIERTQAQAVQVQLRALVPGQAAPVAVDLPEHRACGDPPGFRIQEQGQRAGQVGILHRHAGHVAAEQVFHALDAGRIDPAGAGGGDQDQRLAIEAADPFEFFQRQPRPFLRRLAGGQAGIYAQR